MSKKPTYRDLEQKARNLEEEALRRKEIEGLLLESERKLRSLVETTSDWVWELDINGVYTYASPRAKNILGYDVDEIVGVKFYEFLADDEIQSSLAFFKKMSEEPKPFSGRKITQIRKDGKRVIIEVNGTPVFNKDGKLSGYCGCDKDITERKRAETVLKERESELDLKNESLEEMNAVLRVLLKKREEDKSELEEKVLLNIQSLIMPFLDKLTSSTLDARQKSYVSILKSNLNDIVSPFSRKLSSKHLKLTPAQIQIANLVKEGKDTKEIAGLLNLSIMTIETHRRNIRRKIGLKNRKQHLRTHLLDLSNE